MAKDDRVTMKVDRALWSSVSALIKEHPEWGILSVPEFVRRAIDSEIRARKEAGNSTVIDLPLRSKSR
ncbi:MAG: hypothetical protein KKE24_01875 [Candidatus Thermoplasmatota archaeon]|nr:hypothetical protein [Candidatus Thermoplasmatota archaeon]